MACPCAAGSHSCAASGATGERLLGRHDRQIAHRSGNRLQPGHRCLTTGHALLRIRPHVEYAITYNTYDPSPATPCPPHAPLTTPTYWPTWASSFLFCQRDGCGHCSSSGTGFSPPYDRATKSIPYFDVQDNVTAEEYKHFVTEYLIRILDKKELERLYGNEVHSER